MNTDSLIALYTYLTTLVIIIAIIICHTSVIDKIDKINPTYEVYYEYNVIAGDTIPCDTIYKLIN